MKRLFFFTMRVKVKKAIRFQVCFLFLFLLINSVNLSASINPKASIAPSDQLNSSQLVSLNLELKSKNEKVKSNLVMPFYQTAELEKKVGDKNFLIELNPKRGKNLNEIAVELKLFRQNGSRAIYKKEIIARLNEDAMISIKGLSLKVRPVIN